MSNLIVLVGGAPPEFLPRRALRDFDIHVVDPIDERYLFDETRTGVMDTVTRRLRLYGSHNAFFTMTFGRYLEGLLPACADTYGKIFVISYTSMIRDIDSQVFSLQFPNTILFNFGHSSGQIDEDVLDGLSAFDVTRAPSEIHQLNGLMGHAASVSIEEYNRCFDLVRKVYQDFRSTPILALFIDHVIQTAIDRLAGPYSDAIRFLERRGVTIDEVAPDGTITNGDKLTGVGEYTLKMHQGPFKNFYGLGQIPVTEAVRVGDFRLRRFAVTCPPL
jgi:hypothetical protein